MITQLRVLESGQFGIHLSPTIDTIVRGYRILANDPVPVGSLTSVRLEVGHKSSLSEWVLPPLS